MPKLAPTDRNHPAQFVVAPYSLFVSFGLAAALAPQVYLGHYISFALIETLSASLGRFVLPTSVISSVKDFSSYFNLPIGPAFIATFFAVDQAACLYVHFCTPSKKFTAKETLTHAVWGFLGSEYIIGRDGEGLLRSGTVPVPRGGCNC